MGWFPKAPWNSQPPHPPVTAESLDVGFTVDGGLDSKTLIVDSDVRTSELGRGTAKYLSSYATFADACDATGYLIVDTNVTATSDTFAAAVEVQKGAVITVPNGVTLNINLPLIAGSYQVFNCTGTGQVLFNGITGIVDVKWFGALGDGSTDDTTAINKANAAANMSIAPEGSYESSTNQKTLYFPSGRYRVTSADLSVISANIEASDAIFQPSDDTGYVLHVQQPVRYGYINIRGIIGSHCDRIYTPNPTKDANNIGLLLSNVSAARIKIGQITGLAIGIFLNGYQGSANEPVSSNQFSIDTMMWNTFGIVQRAGTDANESRTENNTFRITYMVGNTYGVWLDSSTNSGGLIISNSYEISVLECHYAADETGLYLTGANTYSNSFKITGDITAPSGTGKIVSIGASHDNFFELPDDAVPYLNLGTASNVFDIWSTDVNTQSEGGWTPVGESWAYASATTITVPTGAAARYCIGDKLRFKQGAGFKYVYVVGVAATVLTVSGGSDYTVANVAITDIYYSHGSSPIGFPQFFTVAGPAWTTTGTAFTNQPTTPSNKFTMNGRLATLTINARCHATSGGTGIFIATFTAGQLPNAILPQIGQSQNKSTAVFGWSWLSAGALVVNMCDTSSGTLATNSEYFMAQIQYQA